MKNKKLNVFIIHGSYGHPKENWIPWLKSELEKQGYQVFVPKFPTPKNQSLKNWLKVFERYKKHINKKTIFVGHSIGVAFLLRVIEGLDKPIKAAYLISGFIELLGNPVFDDINKTFVEKKFDWRKIKTNCQKFYLFHSDNDPYVPLEKAQKLAKKLGEKIILVKNAGHFNEKAGYKKFELLLEKIL
jgi:Predicted esterase of the alpha/beta hydrolase fold